MATTKDPAPKGQTPAGRADKQDDVTGMLGEAQRRYCETLQKAWSPVDAHVRAATAHADYVKASLDAGLDPSRSFDAYLEYARALQEAWLPEGTMERMRAAFQDYARGVQRAWAQVNVEDMDPYTLANLYCHTTTVMLYASSYPQQGSR